MPRPTRLHKETGLRRGDATRISRRHGCTVTHVIEVAAGRRNGRPALLRTIQRYQEAARMAAPDAA